MWCRCNRCSCASNCVWSLGVMIVYLVGVEVRWSDIDVEQVVATGELQGSGFRQRPGAGLQDVGDVLGAEGLEGEPVGDGACYGVGGVDLGQGQNLADVVAGVEPALLQAVVIGCRIGRQSQEVHHQALFAGAAALGDQSFGVVWVFDVLVTAIAAGMAGDKLIVEVDADPVRIGFDRDAAVRVAGRDGILIGIQGDAELAGGDAGRGVGDVVGVRIERSEMRTLPREQINGPLLRFAMDAQVGDGIEPHLRGRLDGAEVGQFDAVQEVLFDVAHPRFDAPLLVAATDIAGDDRKAAVAARRCRPADLRLSTMILAGTPPHAVKACSWQARKCSVVWETVNSTYMRRLKASTMTKNESRRRVSSTATVP